MPLPSVADVLRRVPLSKVPLAARTLLDVGCGIGSLARAYRPLNPIAKLYGIDSDEFATEQAKSHFDSVFTGDVEANLMPFDVTGGFDCIVYDSILEHLNDPWALIRRHAEALTPDGVMLISLPNPDHWRTLDHLLRGSAETNMAMAGLPSFNHANARRQISRAGLTVCDAIECEADLDSATQFVEAMKPGLLALGIDPASFLCRTVARRLLWRVRKDASTRLIVSGNMLAPVGGVSHVRVVNPLTAIATDPDVRTEVTDHIETGTSMDVPRIFVLHRPALIGDQGQGVVRRLIEAGYLVVTEFDDHPDHFEMMQMGGDMSFRGVHALQTSTPALAEVLRKYNPEVGVFPNAIVTLPEIRNFADPNAVTLFFGALNREADWGPFMPVLNEIAQLAKERLKFQVVHDRGFFEALQTPYKAFTPTCDYETYFRLLGSSEISFMPLADTPFNRAKSDLKFIEAGACRVAALASTVVYPASIEDGTTGLLFRNEDELRRHLLRLVALPGLARRLGDSARDYVIKHRMLAYQVAPRIAWYRSLWERREALDEALRQRMAGTWPEAA